MSTRARRYRMTGGDGSRPVVADVLEQRGWQKTGGDDWDFWWERRVPLHETFASLAGRRMNHLPGMTALGHKDGLHRTLTEARARRSERGAPLDFAIAPPTYLFPEDEQALLDNVAHEPEAVWIEKPRTGARGEGVRLLTAPQLAKRDKTVLVQRYLARPYLLDGFKFTLRFYLLFTSTRPLVAWLYGDGFVKLASRPFSLDREHRADRFRHLTNPDVLQHDAATPVSSRNLTHTKFRDRLAEAGHDPALVFARIRELAVRTVAAAQGPLARALDKNATQAGCFEMLGLDVMLDADLSPILLECNISPSLSVHAETGERAQEEADLKAGVINDLLRIVDIDGERPPAPPPDASPLFWRKHYDELHERRGRFAPLWPPPDALEKLPLLGAPRGADLLLALGRDRARKLSPTAARALPIEGGLAVHVDRAPALLLLDRDVAHVWRTLEAEGDPDACAAQLAKKVPQLAGAAEQLAWDVCAAWAGEGAFAAPEEAHAKLPAPLAWNGVSAYSLGGLRFALHVAEPAWSRLLLPTLAFARGQGEKPVQASFEVRRAAAGIAIEDELGHGVWVRSAKELPAALHEEIARRAALQADEIGAVDALLVGKGRTALLLNGAALVPQLAGLLDVEPCDDPLADADCYVRVLSDGERRSDAGLERFALLETLLRARKVQGARLSTKAAQKLCSHLSERPCVELPADPQAAVARLQELLAQKRKKDRAR